MILHITFYLPCPLPGGGIIVQETKLKYFIVEGYYRLYYQQYNSACFYSEKGSVVFGIIVFLLMYQ
jgi:hypothetical protein